KHNVGLRFFCNSLVTPPHQRVSDLVRVAFVHLATVSFNKKFRHGRAKIIHGRASYAIIHFSSCRSLGFNRAQMKNERPAIGIIGGSGLYRMEELHDATEHKIDTPVGSPSDTLVGGKLSGRRVYFLPRHGRGHRILPHEINYRANIYALRSLNVRWIISVAA